MGAAYLPTRVCSTTQSRAIRGLTSTEPGDWIPFSSAKRADSQLNIQHNRSEQEAEVRCGAYSTQAQGDGHLLWTGGNWHCWLEKALREAG